MRKEFSKALSLLALLSLVACASQQKAPVMGPPSPGDVMGPVINDQHVEEQTVPNESYGPEVPSGVTPAPIETPPSADGARLCIVLGPGLAKAMAEAAVLDAIRKAKIPVHCVVGTEMGAIVGALYIFSNGSTNNLAWQLFKLRADTYFNYPMISLREPRSTGKRLNEFLRGIFRNSRVETLPIRFATTAIGDESDNTVELITGNLADALSASSAVPGIFEPWKIDDTAYRSAAVADPAPIDLAKKLGGNFIVLVDVLLDSGHAGKSRYQRAFTPTRSLMRLQKKEASFVIQVNSSAIAFDDFGRQGEILSAGAAAAEKALPELKAAWEKWVAGTR